MPLHPADVAFDANGVLYSARYGDVYHSADSGPGQAHHVFIGGNGLPSRWAASRVFTIVETGFGIGLNFLATWQTWRDDPARCDRLHFVSLEKHPFTRQALERIHERYSELAPLAHELRDAWPPLVPGTHRLHFDDGRVTLTLALGDVAEVLPKLRACADAIYLDGFSPARNSEMWTAHAMKALARLSRAGTTLATWSTAAAVREHLEAAGFTLEKRAGFGHKREMLVGRYEPRSVGTERTRPAPIARHAIVVGAGLAGAAACERLASRGWRVDSIEARAGDAPQKFAGVFHPHVSADDALRSRASRVGFLYAVERWRELERNGHALAWDRCGVLQLASDRDQETRFAATSAALAYPADYARYVAREEAEALAGCSVRSGGWWYQSSGWMRPATLIAAQLASCGDALTRHTGRAVMQIRRDGDLWHALDENGATIAAAPVIVLANSADAQRLAPLGETLGRVRGQITFVPAERTVPPRTAITGRGYVLPANDGAVIVGSTYDSNDPDPNPRTSGHETNLAHLARLLPDTSPDIDPASLDGAVGFRSVAPDRMPLVGALPDIDVIRANSAELGDWHLPELPRRAGLYALSGFASRGLVWASIGAEMLASMLESEPSPVESDVADALDPARFVMRRLRRGRPI